MADKAPHRKQYTAEDIERYHSGKMSVQERHQLEKAALDDPFLADALDGYTHTTTPQADLADIHARLSEKTRRGKLIGIPAARLSWLKVAAAVLFIATAGWLLYRSASGPAQELATQPPASSADAAETINPGAAKTEPSAGTPSLLEASPVEAPVALDQKQRTKASNPSSPAYNTKAATDMATEQKDQGPEQLVKRKEESGLILPDTGYFRNQINNRSVAAGPAAPRNFFNGRVVDPSNRGVKNATVVTATNLVVRTDNSGNFSLPAKDSTADATVKAMGFETNKAKLNTEEPIVIVLHPLPNPPKEEEVLLSKEKRDANFYARKERMITDTLEPAQGWLAFDNYIAENLQNKNNELLKSYEGEVELSFEINKNGEPVNIKVVRSLCARCDEEAKRLLKEGPKWKRGKSKQKGKVTIRF